MPRPDGEAKRQCIGYGEREGKCSNMATEPPYLWCANCERHRRETITAQMAKISEGFGRA